MKDNTLQYYSVQQMPTALAAAYPMDDHKYEGYRMRWIIAVLLGLALMAGISDAYAKRPVKVTAAELIGKVYGVADPRCGREECRDKALHSFSAAPVESDGAEWMGEAEGFVISYGGQTPESEAMARYSHNDVTGYGYIFYFPYSSHGREKANREQCRFCSSLMEDLVEIGAIMGADPQTEDLFDVTAIYKGNDVQLTLSEITESESATDTMAAGEIPADRSGQFILMVSIVPADALHYTADL